MRMFVGAKSGGVARWLIPETHRGQWHALGGRIIRAATADESSHAITRPTLLAKLSQRKQEAPPPSPSSPSSEAAPSPSVEALTRRKRRR